MSLDPQQKPLSSEAVAHQLEREQDPVKARQLAKELNAAIIREERIRMPWVLSQTYDPEST